MAGRLLKTADSQHDHHQRLGRGVRPRNASATLQRRAAVESKRHSQRIPSRRFLGRDPPVVFLQAAERCHHKYVHSARQEHI